MKMWEIDLSVRSNYIDSNGVEWVVNNDYETLTGVNHRVDVMEEYKYNLKELISLNFEPVVDCVDWSKVEVDTPCLVKERESGNWLRRYFAGIWKGKPYFWHFGATSWSIGNEGEMTAWKYCKLADTTNE